MGKSIILVRHGEVQGITPPRFRGRTQLPLTPKGEQQAELTAAHLLRTGRAGAVWAGPLDRCQRTARIIAQTQGLVPETRATLDDIDYGLWQGHTYAEIEHSDPAGFESWMTHPEDTRIPAADTLQQSSLRAIAAIAAALAERTDDTIIFVSHDSINRLILLHALDMPLARYHDLEQSPCGISRIQYNGARWKIRSMNETGHLDAPAS
jgi:probable phosphoglycerate mutase